MTNVVDIVSRDLFINNLGDLNIGNSFHSYMYNYFVFVTEFPGVEKFQLSSNVMLVVDQFTDIVTIHVFTVSRESVPNVYHDDSRTYDGIAAEAFLLGFFQEK